MKPRVVVLGAGFGGLELTTMLSEAIGEELDLTLIDKNDCFFFGFSKLDVMFRHKMPESVRIPYRSIVKPGVAFRQETITEIDPDTRRVTTDAATYEADVLVVALGAVSSQIGRTAQRATGLQYLCSTRRVLMLSGWCAGSQI